MAKIRTYEIGNNRLSRSRFTNMLLDTDFTFHMDKEKISHTLLLPALVAQEAKHRWGRLHLEYELGEECACSVYVMAADNKQIEDILFSDKTDAVLQKNVFEKNGSLCGINCTDILLYHMTGKYLWIFIEITGMGCGKLYHIWVNSPGDTFFDTFPEIYRENGDFFHRYVSIFSSLYQDFQKEIETFDRYLDLDSAPKNLLYQYAEWLGLELDGDFLPSELLVRIIKNLYDLNRRKGTKGALLKLSELVLSKKAIVVERGLILANLTKEELAVYNRLYGDNRQDITVLINHPEHEMIKSKLLFLLKQFKPVRSNLRLIFYENSSRMDSYCYMDLNAKIYEPPKVTLDSGRMLAEYRFQT